MDFFVSGDELKNTDYDQLERYDHLEKTSDGDQDGESFSLKDDS